MSWVARFWTLGTGNTGRPLPKRAQFRIGLPVLPRSEEIAAQIGKANEEMIRSCDIVLGVLDGPELDSGTASEIGFAAALGKRCYGLRTDFRDCG